MIVEIDKKKKNSPFLEYSFFQEADDSKPSNMKVINVRVSDGRRPDYTKLADDDETEEEPVEDSGDGDAPNEPEMDTEDYSDTGEGEDTGEEPSEGTDEPVMDTEDYSEEDPESQGDDGDPEGDSGDGDAPNEPEMDTEDYSDTDEGEDTVEEPSEGTDDGSEQSDDSAQSNGNPVENLYKYNLYQKFQNVHTSLGEYIEQLNVIVSDDAELNREYKELTSKLVKLKDLMRDYMIMKFSKSSFTKSMFFYQRIMTSVNIIIQTLKKIRIKEIKSKT